MSVSVGDKVFIMEGAEEYVVMRVDQAQQVADLMTTTGIRRLADNVALSALRPADDSRTAIVASPSEPGSAA